MVLTVLARLQSPGVQFMCPFRAPKRLGKSACLEFLHASVEYFDLWVRQATKLVLEQVPAPCGCVATRESCPATSDDLFFGVGCQISGLDHLPAELATSFSQRCLLLFFLAPSFLFRFAESIAKLLQRQAVGWVGFRNKRDWFIVEQVGEAVASVMKGERQLPVWKPKLSPPGVVAKQPIK